jgi:hypothetical protein
MTRLRSTLPTARLLILKAKDASSLVSVGFEDTGTSSQESRLTRSLDPPTTQVQCDLNKSPAGGFAIDGSNTLTYGGSSQFYACPATDTEYNVYVHPDFGQTKCFPITLTASSCGSQAPPSCSNSTVWQTITITSVITTPVTLTVTGPNTCSSTTSKVCNRCASKTKTTKTSYTTSASGTGCHKCTGHSNSTGIWNTMSKSYSTSTTLTDTNTATTESDDPDDTDSPDYHKKRGFKLL